MKNYLLFGTLLTACLAPVSAPPASAQNELIAVDLKRTRDLPFPRLSPAEAEKIVIPNQIVLHLRQATLAEALDELQRQSGVKLNIKTSRVPEDALEKKLSLDLETRSYNAAIKAIFAGAGVKASLGRFSRIPSILGSYQWGVRWDEAAPEAGALQAGEGPFGVRLETVYSTVSKSVEPRLNTETRRAAHESLTLGFEAVTEPQFTEIGTMQVHLTRADDEQGHSLLLPDGEQSPLLSRFGDTLDTLVSARLLLPTTGAQKIARIEGIATYILPVKRDKWEMADVLNNKGTVREFRSGNQTIRVELQSATRNGREIDVALKVSSPSNKTGPIQSPFFLPQFLFSSLHLQSANNQDFRASNRNSGTIKGDLIAKARFELPESGSVLVLNEKGGFSRQTLVVTEPFSLVFDAPTEWVQTEVPFSFSDVPLP